MNVPFAGIQFSASSSSRLIGGGAGAPFYNRAMHSRGQRERWTIWSSRSVGRQDKCRPSVRPRVSMRPSVRGRRSALLGYLGISVFGGRRTVGRLDGRDTSTTSSCSKGPYLPVHSIKDSLFLGFLTLLLQNIAPSLSIP